MLLIGLAVVTHPGGFSGGRGSCGTEYTSPVDAFNLPDMSEAWYVRRMATCASPFMWLSWETTSDAQQVYVAASAPAVSRFMDRLQFNGVLFGPGLPRCDDDCSLPGDIAFPDAFDGQTLGRRSLVPPAEYATCSMVQSNEVMRQYASVRDGRCMESIAAPADYQDPLVAGLELVSEWLYSENHQMAAAGRYFLVVWLTDRSSGEVAQGKFDLTLGPWSWSGYADKTTTEQTQSQGSSCACAFNALEWREDRLERLSHLPAAALVQALPQQTCGAEAAAEVGKAAATASTCRAASTRDPLSDDTRIEWSGEYELLPGSTYSWSFHASVGCGTGGCELTYPDPAIEVMLVPSTVVGADRGARESAADAMMKQTPDTVQAGETVDLGSAAAAAGLKMRLVMRELRNTSESMATAFALALPAGAPARWWAFTQHVPHEFSASFFACTSGACSDGGPPAAAAYVYPNQTSLYFGASSQRSAADGWRSRVTTSVGATAQGLSRAAIAGIVAGCAVLVALSIAAVAVGMRRAAPPAPKKHEPATVAGNVQVEVKNDSPSSA